MGIMNIFAIVTGVLFVIIAVGSTIVSSRCLHRLDPDVLFMSIVALMCGVAAILAGTYLE